MHFLVILLMSDSTSKRIRLYLYERKSIIHMQHECVLRQKKCNTASSRVRIVGVKSNPHRNYSIVRYTWISYWTTISTEPKSNCTTLHMKLIGRHFYALGIYRLLLWPSWSLVSLGHSFMCARLLGDAYDNRLLHWKRSGLISHCHRYHLFNVRIWSECVYNSWPTLERMRYGNSSFQKI